MPSDTLRVVLNRERLNGAEAPSTFAADGPFTIALDNRGKPVHVHLRFRDRLAELADVGETNHYVDEGETRTVRVDVADVSAPVSGRLDVVTGHGADGAGVELTVGPPRRPAGVDVDESLSHPGGRAPAGNGDEGGADDGSATLVDVVDPPRTDSVTLLVAGFALLALVLAGAAAATLGSLAVTLGLVAVVLSVGGALYVLWA